MKRVENKNEHVKKLIFESEKKEEKYTKIGNSKGTYLNGYYM